VPVYTTTGQAAIFQASRGPLPRDRLCEQPTEWPHKARLWARIGPRSFFLNFHFQNNSKITLFANKPLCLIRINMSSSLGDFYMNAPASFKAFLINPFSLEKSL
jgi:hypothetical protein